MHRAWIWTYFKQLSACAWEGVSVGSVPPWNTSLPLSGSTERNEDAVQGVQDTLELSEALKHL